MNKFKKNDTVIVIAGKDLGARGSIRQIVEKNNRVMAYVDGVKMVKKCVKANPNANEKGGIREQESLIDCSNIAIYNEQTEKADRVGFRILADGAKVRFYKSTNEVITN